MKGIKHNGNVTIETPTGFKGRRIHKASQKAQEKETSDLFKELGIPRLDV